MLFNHDSSNFTTDSNSLILKIEGLQSKFDTNITSDSLAVALGGDYHGALVISKIQYWAERGYGAVIDGYRWIRKSIHEFITDTFRGMSRRKIEKAIKNAIDKGFLIREKLYSKQFGHNYAPKNRTYYYRVNLDKIREVEESLKPLKSSVLPPLSKTDLTPPIKQFSHCCENKSENTIKKITIKEQQTRTDVGNGKVLIKKEWEAPKEIEIIEVPPEEKISSDNNLAVDSSLTDKEKSPSARSTNVRRNTTVKPDTTKIKNCEWRSHLQVLEEFGVTGNKTVIKTIKSYSTEKVEKAIELLREKQASDSTAVNPAGYFVQALKEGWTVVKPLVEVDKSELKISEGIQKKMKELEIPFDKEVIETMAKYDEFQIIGALNYVFNHWESIKMPRAMFLKKLPEQPSESRREVVKTASDYEGYTLSQLKRMYPSSWRDAATRYGVSFSEEEKDIS